MFKKAFLEFRVGHCGGCRLRIRFWPVDAAKLTCPSCGLNHEVECDSALNLTTGEKTVVMMLVEEMEKSQDEGRIDVSEN